jgi:SAM-dependent methyltransferase
VAFNVPAAAYDSFMGRYSSRLAVQMADLAGVEAGQRVVDVGCGPGALTEELVRRVGADAVAAADPSEPFVAAVAERFPGVDVRLASAEELPFPDGTFDAALAQLVVHFMADPVRGLAEMARVTREGGVVAACVWDHESGQTPIGTFWEVVAELGLPGKDESDLAGAREGQLVELFTQAGLRVVEQAVLEVRAEHESFEDWWQPFTLGVGPAGSFYAQLGEDQQREVRERCRARLGDGPFTLDTRAWAARGIA